MRTITLKNLNEASLQEVFDQVARHLLTQKKVSRKEVFTFWQHRKICAYRGEDGLKCAAGCLIADDEYYEEMEGVGWSALASKNLLNKHKNVIDRLQFIHDRVPISSWKFELLNFADRYDLNTSVLDEFTE